jgi:hypothetical protein
LESLTPRPGIREQYLPVAAMLNYAPKGMMKGDVAVPVRLPTGYIGITEGKVPKEFHLSRVLTFPRKTA